MEGQTAQRPKEKVEKEKQRSTKHTHITRTPLKILYLRSYHLTFYEILFF